MKKLPEIPINPSHLAILLNDEEKRAFKYLLDERSFEN